MKKTILALFLLFVPMGVAQAGAIRLAAKGVKMTAKGAVKTVKFVKKVVY